MGNCGTKPATNEGETPAPAPEQKAEEVAVESREIVVGEEEKETKVIYDEPKVGISDSSTQTPSLGQLISEVEGKVTEEAISIPSEEVKESTDTVVKTKEVVATSSKTEEAEHKKETAEPVVVAEEKKKPEEEKK